MVSLKQSALYSRRSAKTYAAWGGVTRWMEPAAGVADTGVSVFHGRRVSLCRSHTQEVEALTSGSGTRPIMSRVQLPVSVTKN